MKLRLPHNLQTAILTAFASVTFFTVGTATLGAARGEEAPEFASFTDTGFEVSEEELEVNLGEEEEEETKEPDSAPTNHAGFNGIRESSDDADRQLAIEATTESSIDTENVGTADQANYTGTSADLPSNDLGFTSNPYEAGSDTSNGSDVDSPVTSFTQAPQIAPTGGDSAAGIGSGSSTSNETTTSPVSVFGNIGSGLGAFGGSSVRLAAPVSVSSPATFGAAGPEAAASTNLGKFLFMGDSITHGVVDQTYRWQMFKGFVDNGISFDLNGPKSGYNSNPTNMNDAGSAYGKVSFENVHYAQSSGRAYEMISGNRYGVSVSKVGETDYDTYTLMIATNDILSDTGQVSGVSYNTYADKFDNLLGGTVSYTGADKSLDAQWTWTKGSEMSGNLNTILNSLSLDEDDNFYVLSVPVWAQSHGNHNNASDHAAVAGYNTMLQQWVAEYNKTSPANVQYVDVNKGLTDVTVPDRGGVGPYDFFSNSDRLHPSQQGSIIIGGNLSRGMGLAGRTAGLHRAATTGWTAADSSITLASGASQEIVRNAFIEDQGYTIDFHATFGDGATGGWLDAGIHTGNMNAAAQNVLAITIGDGINSGTLNLAEGYIMWGSNILYCQNNSLSSNDAIRIAYHNGSTADNVAQGYYVWLGDMLIGQGLSSTLGQGWNGIKVSSTGGSATLTGLMYTDTAYAPETDFAVGSNPYYVTQDRGQTVLVPTREAASDHHADPISSGVDWTTATPVSYTGSGTARYAQNGAGSSGELKAVAMNLTSSGQSSWIAAKGGNADYTGDIALQLVEGSYGCATVFGVVNGATLDGNATVELNSSSATITSFTNTAASSLIGGYKGSITGTFKGVVNAGTLSNDIVGGFHTADSGNHIGAVELIVNGGTVNGNVYGGSVNNASNGRIDGNIAIKVTDGTINGSIIGTGTAGTIGGSQINIVLSGGVITGDVMGRNSGFNYAGTTNVTVDGYKPLIKGNITADNVTLHGVEDTEYAGYMDTYRGTVTANSSIILDDYTAKDVMAKLVTQDLTVSGTTKTTIHDLTLTSCSITAGEGTDLTLANSLTLGNSATFSGNITLADGLVIDMTAAGEHQGYSDGDNGYLNNVVVFKQADGAAAGSSIEADWSTIQGAGALQGATFSQDASGNVTAGGMNSGSYHITTGTVYYGGSKAPDDIKTAHDLILEPTSSATLVMASNFEPDCVGGITVAAGAQGARLRINAFQEDGTTPIVILASNVDANAGLVLEGDGTYALSNLSGYTADNGYGLGANVSLDPAWKGTVLVSSSTSTTNANLINFSKLGNSLSTVELNGLTGWATSWAGGTIEQNIKLTNNDGAVAWKNSASNSSGNIPLTNFTGTWSGDGTFEVAPGAGNQRSNYTFSGDISAWTGKLLRSGAGSTVFTFAGDAHEVNADIERTGGNVSLVVNTDTVFKKNVTDINNGLTVANGKHATFNGTTSISGASAIGGTVYNDGAMTLDGTVAVNAGDLTAYDLYEQGSSEAYSGAAETIYEGSGYLTSNSKYYLIKNINDGSLTNTATTPTAGVTLESVAGGLVFTSGTQGTVYYVNKDLSYNAGEMQNATSFVVAASKTFTAAGENFNGRGLVLNEGSTLKNSKTTYFAQSQISNLRLDGNATVNLDGMRISVQTGGTSYSPVEIALNGNTLNVTGTGSDSYFGVVGNATVDAGTIALQGTTKFMVGHNNKSGLTVNAPDTLMTMADGTSLVLAAGNTITLEGLNMVGSGTPSASIAQDGSSTAGNLILAPDAGEEYTFNGTAQLSSLTLDGEGTQVIKLTNDNSNLGAVTVNSGTLKIASKVAQTTNVTVNSGATLAIDGRNNTDYKMRYTLAGGTLANTGENTGSSSVQNDQITLTADSTISGTGNFYMLAGDYGATSLNLATQTLHKTGSNTVILYNTAVTKGTLDVQQGTIDFSTDHNIDRVAADIAFNGGNVTGSIQMTDNIKLTAKAATASSALAVNTDNYALTLDGTGNLTLSGVISGSGSVTKTGDGTVTLSGANTYLGGTTVNGGKLVVNHANALGTGPVNVSGGATMELTSQVSSINGNVTIHDGNTFKLAGEDMLTVNGLLTLEAGATLDLANIFASPAQQPVKLAAAKSGGLLGAVEPAAGAMYVLATANEIDLASSGINLQNLADGYRGTLSTQDATGGSGKELILTLAELSKNLIWDNDAQDNKWDVATTRNWHKDGDSEGSSTFAEGDNVTFQSGAGTAQLQDNITAGTMTLQSGANLTVDTNSHNLTVASLVSADGSNLTKSGAGTATFGGDANTPVSLGTLTVSGGTANFEGGPVTASQFTVTGNGTTVSFDEKLTVTGTARADIGYNNTSNTNETVTFKDGFSYTGTNGYALVIGKNNTVIFGGDSTLSKNIGYQETSKVVLDEGASLTIADFYNSTSTLGSNGLLELRKDAVLAVSGRIVTTGVNNNGGTINLTGASGSNLAKMDVKTPAGNTAATTTLGHIVLNNAELRDESARETAVLNVSELEIGNTAKITQASWNTQWHINALNNGEGTNARTLTWDVTTNHWSNSIMYLDGEGNYSGTFVAQRGQSQSVNNGAYQAHLQINDQKALQNAVLQVTGNDQNRIMSVALKVGTVETRGLQGNANAIIYAGEADATQGNSGSKRGQTKPTSSGTSTLALDVAEGDSFTYAGEVLGGVGVTKTGSGSQSFTGNLSAMNGAVTATAGTLTLDNSGASAGSLASATVNGGTLKLDDMNVSGAVTLSSGTLDLLSATSTGSLNMTGGTLKLHGTNGLTSTTGNLAFTSGTLDLTGMTIETGQNYTLATTTGGSLTLGNVDFTLSDSSLKGQFSLEQQGNSLVLTFTQPEPAKDLIWDGGSDTWDAGTTAHWHEAESAEHVTFNNRDNAIFDSADATATMDGAVTAGSVAVEHGANVTIVTGAGDTLTVTNGITVAEGGTLALQGSGLSGTLQGDGTYVLPTNTGSLGNVQLGNDWEGTVQISGNMENFYINDLATENSWVEAKGVTGYPRSWASGVIGYGDTTCNLKLTDPDDETAAFTYTAGSLTARYTAKFTGDIVGDGTFAAASVAKSQDAYEDYEFSGNISGWYGTFRVDRGRDTVVSFTGDADVVNAAIDRNGHTLGMKIGTADAALDATFNNTVDVSTLTLANEDSSATFMGDTQIATLAGAGTLVVNGAGTTTTIGSGNGFTGGIDLLGGTLDLTNALTGVGAVNLGTGTTAATLKLAGGENAALTSTGTITLGSNLTLDLGNYGSLALEEGGTTSVTLATATGFSGDAGSVSLTGLNLVEGYKASLSVDNTTNLVLTVRDESENLIWLDPSGTWTARNLWYNDDKVTRNTFQHGDSVTIVDGGYDGGTTINMVADASARNMTVTKDESVTATTVTIKDTVNENRLGVKNLTIEGGTTLVANTQMEVTETAALGMGATWVLNSPKDSTISAAISSEFATIDKTGDSTLTLTGDNSGYAGFLNVESGTLAAQGSTALGTGVVLVHDDATLSLEGGNSMSAGELCLFDGSTITFVSDAKLNLSESLTLDSGVTWDLGSYAFDRPAQGQSGTATLITGVMDSASIDNLLSSSIIVPTNVHDDDTLQLSYVAGSVILTYTMDDKGDLFWKGGAGNWNTVAANKPWFSGRTGVTPTQFYDGDNVTFDARAAISSVTLTNDVAAGTVTVENGTHVTLHGDDASLTAGNIVIQGSLGTEVNVDAATVSIAGTGTWTVSGDKDRAFAGEITGTGTLAKSSSGDLLLSGDNSAFAGEIQLNSGTITAGHENALGAGTNIVMGNGTELKGTVNTNGDTFTALKGANSTVSADLVINAAGLTVAGDGTIVLSGEVGGSGSLVKEGFGTATLSGNLDNFTGKVTVEQGTLALDSDFTTSTGFDLTIGSRLQLAEQNEGTGSIITYKDGKTLDSSTINFQVDGTLALRDGTYLDMSNIHLNSDGVAGVAKFDQLQAVDADSIGDTEDAYYYEFIEGIAIENLEGAGGTTYARLVRDDKNHLLYVQTFGDTNGAYWKGDADTGVGEWNRGGSQSTGTTSQWRTEQNGTTKATYNWERKVPMSAYFFELTNSEGNTIDETTVTLVTSFPQGGSGNPAKGAGDVIIDGATKYKFISTDDNYLIMNNQYPVAIIVRSGSTAEFDFGIDASNGSWISVEKGATMIVDTRDKTRQYMDAGPDYAQLYNVTNDGTMDMIVGRTWLKHVVNNQDMSIRAYEDLQTIMASGSIEATVVYNAYGATLTMSGERIDTDYMSIIRDEDVKFTNDGTIVFNGSSITDSTSGKMIDTLPVIGTGVLKTGEEEGAHAEIVFGNRSGVLFATVEQSALELGADVTTFEYGVNITDTTTVLAGKAANFYGGTGVGETAGSLGEVTLEDEATITFGPRVEVGYYGDLTGEVTAQSYDMGHVTAGADSVLTVQKGATVTMDGYNAASGVPAGEIVVGTMPADAPDDYDDGTASLTIAGPAAVDTVRVLADTATITGRADINQIMQDGGELVLNSNSILNGVPVSAEPDAALTGGTVTGGTLKLGTGVTLDQNAVIDVRDGGAYTVSGGTGSRIDATGLELIVDRDSTQYREVVVTPSGASISTTETQIQSGFMSSGDEYVKLFDMASGTTLTSNSEAVYHASASGMMTLIGTDNYSTLQIEGGPDLSQFIGYGYLHTAELALKTYYVRDAYASENQVTLSDIIDATADTEHPQGQLENVVFDITDYNDDDSLLYNGTLTVDENVAVDLFSVSADATAAINIASSTTVTADADSPGVQGNLDLQGSGVYEIQDRNDLGANIALRDDEITAGGEWDGTVRVTGTSTDLTLEDKYVGEGADASTIEFRNWNGALNGGDPDHEIDAQIQLTSTQTAPTAMKLTGEDDIAYTFTNTVSGSGNIDHAEGGNVVMTFAGDTAGWNGTYEQLSDTEDSLTFTGGETVSANVTSGNGTMDLTYGGSVETVAGGVNVYSGGDTPTTMNVAYTSEYVEVTGGITSDAQSVLSLTVGDGTTESTAVFSGAFTGTENATMAVKGGSAAVINTDATLQCVVGETGSSVTVADDATLSLASTDPETGYSEFHDLTNEGTIEMKASGGEIHLVDDTAGGNTYNLGELVLTDPVGTATIETSGVEGKTTNVNITGLTGPKSAAQVLELTNGNGTGTVNYNLGNTDGTKKLNGTIAYGGSGGVTNLVLQENGNSAASAVLETRFTSADAVATANIVVDAEAARVLGLSSDGNSANKTMVVSGATAGNSLEITGDGDYVYAGKLGANLNIAYTGDGSQTIEGGVENFRGKVTVDNGSAQAGVLELLNASSVNITDLTIGANDTLDLKKNDSNVGTAVVSGTMKAGGAGGTPSKLDGSLTLGSGSTYDVSASGGTGGLNLTGALTINQGAQLSTGDMGVVWNMGVGDTYDLAFGVTDMTSFGTDVDWNQGVDASTVFGNGMKEGEYYIRYSGDATGGKGGNVGAVYLFRVAVPEPTTSTLSLLALAALAARRRKR